MIDSLHLFQTRLDQLSAFLDDSETINSLIAGATASDLSKTRDSSESALARLRSSQTERRVHTYATGIIMLYGLLEAYLEDLLMAYVEELDTIISRFDDLPEKIRKYHTNLSAQLIINREQDKYRDRCSEAQIIERLHSCASGGPFRLNALAFIDHKANFRTGTINEFFGAAGVSDMSHLVLTGTKFSEYLARRFPEMSAGRRDAVSFSDLDDLAWRRNIVAHGWPDDTLSIPLMRERIEFVRSLGEGIYGVMQQQVLSQLVKHHARALPKPIDVIDNSIVCFTLAGGAVSKGLRVVARGGDGRYFDGTITSIEVNRIPYDSVCAPPTVTVGCKVDFKAKKNQDFFAIDN